MSLAQPQPIYIPPPSLGDVLTWTAIIAVPILALAIIGGIGYAIGEGAFDKVAGKIGLK